jgi:hypothetical protein
MCNSTSNNNNNNNNNNEKKKKKKERNWRTEMRTKELKRTGGSFNLEAI